MPRSRRTTVRRRGRAASERALLQAFEAMLLRLGPTGVGVNAVLDSAGVGKRLLYKYFGDLRGLAGAWAKERRDPLAAGLRARTLLRRLRALPAAHRAEAVVVDYATRLRAHPWALQVLLAELVQPAALGDALHAMRREIGSGHERLLLESGALESRGALEHALVLQAAATYLALRARFAPDYNGIDLASAAGWRTAMNMLRGTMRTSARSRRGLANGRPRPRELTAARARRAGSAAR